MSEEDRRGDSQDPLDSFRSLFQEDDERRPEPPQELPAWRQATKQPADTSHEEQFRQERTRNSPTEIPFLEDHFVISDDHAMNWGIADNPYYDQYRWFIRDRVYYQLPTTLIVELATRNNGELFYDVIFNVIGQIESSSLGIDIGLVSQAIQKISSVWSEFFSHVCSDTTNAQRLALNYQMRAELEAIKTKYEQWLTKLVAKSRYLMIQAEMALKILDQLWGANVLMPLKNMSIYGVESRLNHLRYSGSFPIPLTTQTEEKIKHLFTTYTLSKNQTSAGQSIDLAFNELADLIKNSFSAHPHQLEILNKEVEKIMKRAKEAVDLFKAQADSLERMREQTRQTFRRDQDT